MKIQIQDKTKKRRFIQELSYLQIKKIPYLLIKTGKDRLRAFSGDLSNDELLSLWRLLPVEGIGLYIGKQMIDKRTGKKESRLSIDGLHLLKEEVKKNILPLNKKQEEKWWRGKDIELSEEQTKNLEPGQFIAVQSQKKDFIGTGKLSQDKKILFSFLPKERRIRD